MLNIYWICSNIQEHQSEEANEDFLAMSKLGYVWYNIDNLPKAITRDLHKMGFELLYRGIQILYHGP